MKQIVKKKQFQIAVVLLISSYLIMMFAPRSISELAVLVFPWNMIPVIFLGLLFWMAIMLGVEIGSVKILEEEKGKGNK